MNAKLFSEAISEINDRYYAETANYRKKNNRPLWIRWAAFAACLMVAAIVTIPIIQHYRNVTDNEPHEELTVAEAKAAVPFGAMYPETVLDGYALEDDTVNLYNGIVMKAVYCNENIDDVMTIYIAEKNYFGDVELNTVLYPGNLSRGTKIYLKSGDYIVEYYFSTRDIADIENFEDMVTSAVAFKK